MSEIAVHSLAAPFDGATADVLTDFASIARHYPDHAATMHNGAVCSYRDLAERVRQTALRYQSRLTGVSVSHNPAVVEHLLGILAAGGAFCPIDAALPATRQQELAKIIGLPLWVNTVTEDVGPVGDERGTDQNHGLTARPNDAAYVLCTSGSTGTPKPVEVSRHALAVTARALRELFELGPQDRVLQFASLGWDTCLEEMIPALTAGATVVFDDAAHSHSFPRFVRMLAEREVTVLDLPTAFWHELVLFLHEMRAQLPGCVRLVIIGGERVDRTRLRQWRELGTGAIRLLNTYGCTETTMVTHAVQLSGPGTDLRTADNVEAPLGRALPHVIDHVGADGELLVSGPGLATGYRGAPELTEAEFPVIDHGDGPKRWFRTGDLVSRDECGLVHPRGRTDEQVKVLGVRVHPAEVEAQLSSHPAVAGTVVIGEKSLGRTILAAYVVPVASTTAAELKRYLRARLPSQFIPSKVIFMAELRYTASGKIDRAATARAAADHASEGAVR